MGGVALETARRVQTCRLIEKMEQNPELAKQLGLTDVSKYRGKLKRVERECKRRKGERISW